MKHYSERITIDAQIRFGKPTIRGMRISVYDILSWFASGMTAQEIINDFPELTLEDLQAALSYAADREHKIFNRFVKLLFDQNISYRVSKNLKNIFPDCGQVRELHLENKPDKEIWLYAKNEGYIIVTFDADFYDLVTLYGHPPKVIWLRIGNAKTDTLIQLFQTHFDLIRAFIDDANYAEIGCLEIDA